MVDLPSQPLGVLDPAFEAIALETGECTYGLPGPGAPTARGAALAHSVPFSTLLAAVRFIAPYAGDPADGVATTDPWLAGFTASRTDRAWGEAALSGKERAYLALTAVHRGGAPSNRGARMYAIIRRYRATAPVHDLMHRVDREFADRGPAELRALLYQAIDTGDGTAMTVTPVRHSLEGEMS